MNQHHLSMNGALLLVLMTIATLAIAVPSAESVVKRDVISGGATDAQSSSFRLRATTGQPVVGRVASDSYRINQGYWVGGGGLVSCCVARRGNTDQSPDDAVTLGDLTVLIDHLFISLEPLWCWEEGNTDASVPEGEGSVTLGDLTVLIDHLFISLDSLPLCP